MGLLDRYEVLRHLGHGAAGDVYLARDRLSAGREVALKTIHARVDDLLRAAFEREFATMASVSVPGVAQVYDFGVLREQPGKPGGPFFTRAYIEGTPLDVAAARLPLEKRIDLFVAVARVLAPLHRAGVVHGDIKPGNAIIDTQGQAWLIDFGLARTHAFERGRDSFGPAGTPPFMAPELLRGDRASVAADIYALGVTLWSLVLGELPYAALGKQAVAAKLDGKAPEIPVSASELARNTLLLAARALAFEPLDRFPSVDELIVALTRPSTSERANSERAPSDRPASERGMRVRAGRPFVPPRPRGHAELLATLESLITERASARGAGVRAEQAHSAAWLVNGPAGGGKSLLLRELKWRLALRSHVVLEVFADRSFGASPLVSLVEQLIVVLGDQHPSSQLGARLLGEIRAGKVREGSAAQALAALFAAATSEASLVLLVDDIDRAEPLFGAVLRSAMHADSQRGIAVVASAEQSGVAAARELHAERELPLPRLAAEDIAALAGEALGPLDASVVTALVEHVAGLPGTLMSALLDLSALTAVTPADVHKLEPGEAALALTQARLSVVAEEHLPLLHVLALSSALPVGLVHAVLALFGGEPDAEQTLLRLQEQGLIVRAGGDVLLADSALRKAIGNRLDASQQVALALRVLDAPTLQGLDELTRAQLAVLAQDDARVRQLVPSAAKKLIESGACAAACELLRALLPRTRGEPRRAALLELAGAQHALGEDESAILLLVELAREPGITSAEQASAAVIEARALTALGRFDDAVVALGRVPADTGPEQRVCVQRELAKLHLRRGDYAAVENAVHAGLASAAEGDPVRVELLCSLGMVASYRSEHAAARQAHEEALRIARAHGDKRDQGNALSYLAIGSQRAGDMAAARDLLAQSLEIARELGDVGNMATASMNLGAVLFYLGEPAAAAEHYESAARLALRAGRRSTHAQARHNLAHIHIYFGLYELAREEVSEVLEEAEAAGHKFIAAQATALMADLLARSGHVERALIGYDDAIARYTKLGQSREVAEHHLDAAEALLDRGGPVDTSAAAARLAISRELVDREKLEDWRLRLELLVARARVASGDAEGARESLSQIVERSRAKRDRDIEWSALSALALAHETLGASFAASRDTRAAAEVLEAIALRVPREHREAFWHDPRRRAVRARAREAEEDGSSRRERSEPQTVMLDAHAERERLLEIIKRLAGEHDLDRLLERITESAVDLSGAQRGSVLLVDADGSLMPHVTRMRKAADDEAHTAFSRSIAEAVLIDGEPIVTVDATVDGRLQEYVSVHKLMLRSVACLPIRGPSGTVGVLYLEHRRSRGRFDESAVDLLCAFADQAAIAIENARLLGEVRRQKQELEAKNEELARAKENLEDALLARTRQLNDVQRELSRATLSSSDGVRHGMVGKSPAMKRVFDAIERLASTPVPVVIRGESGTGKELVARAVHYAGSRAKAPFVAINCGALPEALLESELFGHVKGAFSGAERDKRGMLAAASGGTLFLDEVSDMPPRMQVDLLRVLQEGKVCRVGSDVEEAVDVRVVTATQRPLADLVAEGRFREDLMYRLSVVELALPALRDRRDDIPALCDHFLRLFAERQSLPRRHLTRAALARLLEHRWPGNIRQLEHVLLQASVMAEGASIDAADLGLDSAAASTAPSSPTSHAVPTAPRVENLDHHRVEEKQRILEALESCGWNRVKAAQILNMPRRTFYRRLSDYSILG